MSSPESVSSMMASFGSSTAIWKISFRFFSPPENPSLTGRFSRLLIDVEDVHPLLDERHEVHGVQLRLAPVLAHLVEAALSR